jgi:hypothetical protein
VVQAWLFVVRDEGRMGGTKTLTRGSGLARGRYRTHGPATASYSGYSHVGGLSTRRVTQLYKAPMSELGEPDQT